MHLLVGIFGGWLTRTHLRWIPVMVQFTGRGRGRTELQRLRLRSRRPVGRSSCPPDHICARPAGARCWSLAAGADCRTPGYSLATTPEHTLRRADIHKTITNNIHLNNSNHMRNSEAFFPMPTPKIQLLK